MGDFGASELTPNTMTFTDSQVLDNSPVKKRVGLIQWVGLGCRLSGSHLIECLVWSILRAEGTLGR